MIFVSSPFTAGRYHSLVIEKESFPSDVLEITAWTEDGLIMAARHKVHRHIQVVLLGYVWGILIPGTLFFFQFTAFWFFNI